MTADMKTVFYCHANQTHSYMKGFAPAFVSKVKVFQLGNDLLYRHFAFKHKEFV